MPDVCGDIERAIALVAESSAEAARQGARLVCFPEAYLQGYVTEREHVDAFALELGSAELSRLLRPLADVEPAIVVGLFEADAGGRYNSAIVLERGRVVGRYRKRHLIGRENELFVPGDEQPVFELDGLRFSINICYDMQFRECAAGPAAAGATLLVCPANNMLSRATAEQWKDRHNELRCEHARSAGLWLLSADVTGERGGRVAYGPTALIDPQGRVVEQLPLMRPGVLVVDIPTG
jgi:predicted amidohydrolase